MDQFLEGIFHSTPFFAAFLAGLLTFLSPCVLPLAPAYLSYISGQSLRELKNTKGGVGIFFQALSFVLGFGLVFMLLGASMAKIIEVFAPLWLKQFAGIIVVLFGLHFLGLRFKILYKLKKFEWQQKRFSKLLTPFILGLSFSLGWTPCIGPIFTSIVILGGVQEQYGLFLMFGYTLGLAIPFLAAALLIQQVSSLLDRAKKYVNFTEKISGILLILLGAGICFGTLDRFGNL